jgi:hypothetical protein
MTTLTSQCTYREWRVNRIREVLDRISVECGDPKLTRPHAQALAKEAHNLANELADIFVCPVCGNPDSTTCMDCPVGSLTARPDPAFRSTHAMG